MIKMAKKKVKLLDSKNFTRKIKSPFIIYADFQSILVPENNGKQNPDAFYINQYQNQNLSMVLMINLASLFSHI